MSESTGRRSLALRKTATGVDFQIPVNFEETLKGVKPPIIPPLFRSVCEEILARIASRQLSILPAPLSALFSNADAMAGNLLWTAQIDEVIKLLHFEKKGLNEKQRILKRKADLEPHQTSVITRAMFRYIELCSDGIDLTVEFPVYGYLVLGPPLHNEGKPDLRSYIRSLDSFFRAALRKNPIKRDIFCYLMHFLSQIYQLMSDSYRSEPALCGMTRYLLASRFGEELISLHCTECESRIKEDHKGCRVCSYIPTHIQPPYQAQVIDMMLEYIPHSYWREKLNDPRGGLVERSGTATKMDDFNSIIQARKVSSVGDLPHVKATPEKGRKTSKMDRKFLFVGSSRNNGVSLRKSRASTAVIAEESKKSIKTKDSEENADKSSDSQGPFNKTKSDDLPRNGAGSDAAGRSHRSDIVSGPKSIGGRRSGGVGESGGSGIISSALRKDSVSSISLTRKNTPSSGMRSTLFTTPPTLSNESTESTTTERTDRPNIATPRRQVRRKQRRARSRTRRPRGRSPSKKHRQRTRSPGKKKKGRARSPKVMREVGKNRGRKGAKKTPRSRKRGRSRSRRR